MITIDKILQDLASNAATSFKYPLTVTSSDQVIVVMITPGTGTTNVTSVTFSGANFQQITNVNNTNNSYIFYLSNPAVGNFLLTINLSGLDVLAINAMVIGGADKKATPVGLTQTLSSAIPSLTLSVAANSLILDFLNTIAAIGTPDAAQTIFWQDTTNDYAGSFKYGTGFQTVSWSASQTTGGYSVIAIAPANAVSISYPALSSRHFTDLVNSNNLNNETSPVINNYGYFSPTFYQNSFLHTVGRVRAGGGAPFQGPPQLQGQNIGSGIVIDQVTFMRDGNSVPSLNFDHSVSSQDAILVIVVTDNTGGNSSAQFNGVNVPLLQRVLDGSQNLAIFFLIAPPVGTYPVVISGTGGSGIYIATVISILGVNKKITTPFSSIISGNSTSSLITATPASANSLILDAVSIGRFNPSILNNEQTQITNSSTGGKTQGVSYTFSQGNNPVSVGWKNITPSAPWNEAIIILEPSNAASISNPNIRFRNALDLVGSNNLNSVNNINTSFFQPYGYYPSTFYQNSFLHTVGRMFRNANVVVGTIVSETEQETSQIIIDKIFQGQKLSQALSIVNLTMDISIPSPDAVLVVTGGSVIATGAQWTSVQYNGNSLTNLVQASVAGADAEIWYMPYPPVGVGQLTIASGSGGEIYANAMVILGVDKRSTNITVASATDAASTATIGALITPDAPNSLIIDTLSTLNTTTFPTQDSSQTQVFNASALAGNEYVLSTYKIASAQTNMNYNLSVAVNAALVAVAFRPAQAASIWFPNIDPRQLDDVVTVAGLDAEVNPPFGQYGYKPTMFFLNSFLHTIGRTVIPPAGFTWTQLVDAEVMAMPREHFDKTEVVDY